MPAKHAQQTEEIRVDGDSPVEFRICPSRTDFYVGTYCDAVGRSVASRSTARVGVTPSAIPQPDRSVASVAMTRSWP